MLNLGAEFENNGLHRPPPPQIDQVKASAFHFVRIAGQYSVTSKSRIYLEEALETCKGHFKPLLDLSHDLGAERRKILKEENKSMLLCALML